jgi:hypothetical protein
MKHHVGKTLALLGALSFACASPASESEKLDPSLSKFVLSSIPTDIPNPTFVDFGGKVHLVGWDLSPKQAKPGGTLLLKLYWRSVKRVAPGFRLYTHLTGADGKVHEFDGVGPLREARSGAPSSWIPGMIYVDEQTITVPDLTVPAVTLSVGVKSEGQAPDAGEKAPEYKLEVLSGVSDGREGALVARLPTGVSRGGKGKDRDLRRRPPGIRPGSDRRPGMPRGPGPMGRMPAMDKEKSQ